MIKTYLKINLSDVGGFAQTDNIIDLNLQAEISVFAGIFSENLTPNTFGGTVHQKYNLSVGDKFYFLPGVTIPRVKLKDIANSHKVRTVRDINDATHIFIGSDTLHKMTSVSWEYKVNTEAFKQFVNAAHENNNMDDYYYQKITDALEFYSEEFIIADYYACIRLLLDQDIPYAILNDDYCSSSRFLKIEDEYNDLLKSILNKDLYIEDALLEYVNGDDAIIIDETMFATLSEMFNSSDKDNWTLAMEIMANCKYKQSILYLSLLFYDFGSKIDTMSTKRHVNFKSLINYMGIPYIASVDKDDIVDVLIRKNSITEHNMNILVNLFKNDIADSGNSKYFKVKGITLANEIDKLLNKEVIHSTKDDYAPIMNEISEPIIETNGTTESEFSPFGF